MRWCALILVLSFSGLAQQRDFLTADEADQIREAQEPNARLKLYVEFAKQRMALLQEFLKKDKPGRSVFIHDTIEDYTHIIEAIDTVGDDALERKVDINEGMKAVAEAEGQMLAALQKIEDSSPKDLARYDFVLKDAIDTTSDSKELSEEDLGARGREVVAEEKKQKEERDALLGPKEKEAKKVAEDKEQKAKRKAPSLYRPGEKPPDQQ
jgi:hypothetical protein